MENTEVLDPKAIEEAKEDSQEFVATSLTESEILLLKQLRDPDSCAMTVTDICKKIGITTVTYYRAFKKEHFVRKVHDECVGVVQSAVLPVLQTARKRAIAGDLPTSHHWAKMLLEMSGLYVPNKAAQIKAEIKLVFNVPRPLQAVTVETIDVIPEKE